MRTEEQVILKDKRTEERVFIKTREHEIWLGFAQHSLLAVSVGGTVSEPYHASNI